MQSRLGRCWGRAVRIAGILAALVASCVPPDDGQPHPGWELPFPGGSATNDTGSIPGVVVIGDSLMQAGDDFRNPVHAQQLANGVRFFSGASAFVAFAAAATVSHFTRPWLMTAGPSTIQTYAATRAPRVLVIALGTNDVRLLTRSPAWGRYTLTDFAGSLDTAIQSQQGRCVILVNVANHFPESDYSPNVVAVNGTLAARTSPTVRLLDWDSASAPHPDWFLPGDIHHSPAGSAQYINLIRDAVNAALGSGC